MPDRLFPKPLLAARAYLSAAYANRLLGENFCQSVIPVESGDTLTPGYLGSHTLYFLRADTAFTNALAVATASGKTDTATTNLIRAALAGRASVRADLATYGQATWASATTDAGLVPDTVKFLVPYSSQNTDQYNYLYWARAATPYRAHTEWGTFYEGYYRTTKDPRVKWDSTGLKGDAAVARFGGLGAFWPEAKYSATTAPVRMSSGYEMRLIEAEAALVAGDTATARAKMNLRRTAPALPGVTFTNPTAGSTALATQRGIEPQPEAPPPGWALPDSLGLDLRALSGTRVERQDTRLLFQVRTASGSPAFGSQPLYQRIAVSPQDVLRVDVRRMNGVRTGVLATAIAGAVVIAAAEAFGWLRPGTPAQPPGGPPEQRRPW